MANYDASIRIGTKVDTSQMQRLEIQIDKAVQKVEDLERKQEELANEKVPTTDYVEIQTQIKKAEDNLQKLIDKKEKLSATGGGKSAFSKLNYDIEQAKNTISYAKGELSELEASGQAFTPGTSSDAYAKVSSDLDMARRNLEALTTRQGEMEAKQNKVTDAFKRTKTASKDCLTSIQKNTSKANDVIGAFTKRIWGLAKRIFVFSLIAKAFRSMVNGIKEGLQNFAKYNKEYNATMSAFKSATAEFKNALGVAIAPLVQVIVTGLTSLVNALIDAINWYNKFIAIVSGKNTFTVAKKQQIDYAKSLDSTGKSASKTANQLANFDDLEVLKKNDGAGDLANGLNAEEVLNTINPLLDKLEEFKNAFKEGFEAGKGNKDIGVRLEGIKGNLERIKNAVVDIWTSPEVQRSLDTFSKRVSKALGQITGAGASIGLTVAENVTGGIATYLENDKERIKGFLTSMFDIAGETATIFGNFSQAVANILEPLGATVGQNFTANLIGVFASAFMGLTTYVAKFRRDLYDILFTPIVNNQEAIKTAFVSVLKVAGDMLGSLKQIIDHTFDGLNKVYDEHFKPLLDSIRDGISSIMGVFLDVFNNNIAPLLQSIAGEVDKILNGALAPLFDEVGEALGNIADILKELWNGVLVPFISWVTANVLPIVVNVIGSIVSAIGTVGTILSAVITTAMKLLNGILSFVKTGFKNGWTQAFNEIGEHFAKVWEGIKDTAKHYINIIIGFIQNMIDRIVDAVNCIVDVLNDLLSFSIPSWVPGIGGKSWSIDLPHVSGVKIPMLSEGAVIPPNHKFLAMLGDQTSGTNIEAPLDTIKQAVSEVVGNGGQNINIRFTGSLSELARILKPAIDNEGMRIGTSFEVV